MPHEIERASRAGTESTRREVHENSFAVARPRVQSSRKRDSSSDQPLTQDSPQCEDSRRQIPEDARHGETRNSIAGADEEARKPGRPRGIARRMRRRIKGQGATLHLIAGSAEGFGIRGGSNFSRRRSQGTRGRGNPAAHHWQRRKVLTSGRPDEPPAGALRGKIYGATRRFNLGKSRKMQQSGATRKAHRESADGRRDFGATRKIDSIASERCEIRCAPKITSPVKAGRHSCGATRRNVRKRNWYSGYAGQPGFLKPELLKDEKVGETRQSVAGTA